ncbi:hypothetical protein ASPWEDRAFT_226450 [Aspergillus wentii DTO 134E9]|uniref:Uncharacterized protein n=1 Tax=Aspergillus wentii DTO 134E9 TaxID=1073089 RepID=A0A1L9S0G4_ASPWE|nr:uncharacterized protein ASPWEDRAFT_226450 [Aspergillus wentii DTO 134E9]OJJ40652.1 hypothetical protein ASPWEDRAFT_226450 [Aspergillus wentii DTO 134E9]
MCEPISDPRRMYHQWTEAMNCRYFGRGKPYNREDFARLHGKYDALLDIPACLFWDDFHRLYPDTKIILPSRSVDSWYQSVHKTIIAWMRKPSLNILQWVEPERLRPEMLMVKTAYKVICNNDYDSDLPKQRYLEHNARVRAGVSLDRFLELKPGDGWEPLCAFLEVSIPDKPYPKINNTNEFIEGADQADSETLERLTRPGLMFALPVAVVGLTIVWWMQKH